MTITGFLLMMGLQITGFTMPVVPLQETTVDTGSAEYQLILQEEQNKIIIEDYFVFGSKFPRITYARGCVGGYEPASRSESKGRYVNCSKQSFDCGGLMKAYLYIKGLITKKEMVYLNSQGLYELGEKKDPRTAKRGDFMYRRGFNGASSGNMSTHFAVVSRDYTGGNTMWIYDNVRVGQQDGFNERAIRVSCQSDKCYHIGLYRIYVASNGAIALANKKGITVDPFVSTGSTLPDSTNTGAINSGAVKSESLACSLPKKPYIVGLAKDSPSNQIVQRWYTHSTGNMTLVRTFYCENRSMSIHAESPTNDSGICQLHRNRTNLVWINNPLWKTSREHQAQVCLDKWNAVPDPSKVWSCYKINEQFKDKFYFDY